MSQSSSKKLALFYIVGVILENKRIRFAARASGIPLWKIAEKLGVSEPTLTRWLRVALSEERENAIMAVITELSQEENNGIIKA